MCLNFSTNKSKNMINKRKLEERVQRKELILKGALNVFSNLGIEKTTMDEIAVESEKLRVNPFADLLEKIMSIFKRTT